MSDKKTGGPAYPSRGGAMYYVPEEARGDVEKAVQALDQQHEGMSLRDYFAGQAMQSIVSALPIDAIVPGALARASYVFADAMLTEREK